MQHKHTELPPSKFQRKQKKSFKSRQATNEHYQEDKQRGRMPQVHRRFNNNYKAHTSQENYSSEGRCKKCGDSTHVEGFRCPASRYHCKDCHKFGHFSSLCYKRKSLNTRDSEENPEHIN